MTTFNLQELVDFFKENDYNKKFSINMKHPGIICFSSGNLVNEVIVHYYRTGEARILEHNQNDNFILCEDIKELMSNLKIILDYQLETNQTINTFNQNN